MIGCIQRQSFLGRTLSAMLLAPIIIVIAGCDDEASRRQDIAACAVESYKVYPHWNADAKSRAEADDFQYECMKSKGYVYNSKNTDCPTVADLDLGHYLESRPECYRKPLPWVQ